LGWLEGQFASLQSTINEPVAEEDEELTESELLQEHVAARTQKDELYANKLLSMLADSPSLEKQLLALEQLSYIKHPEVISRVKTWLENETTHPFVQFKGMQALKQSGYEGH